VRQALFNIVGARIKDARFLDVCAGSGLVGLEAMSRGALSLTSIEQNENTALNLEASARQLGYAVQVLRLDFKRAIPLLQGRKFDLIFADPPYKSGVAQAILVHICEHKLLSEEGLVIVEHLTSTSIGAKDGALVRFDTRSYGQTALSFFGWQP
jgi:16S rRNA (guanine(966)-N(2))-methyltransferase RsmD